MKKYFELGAIAAIIILTLIFVGYFGNISSGMLWGKSLMGQTNSKVENGYFIDKGNAIRFKLPAQSYVYGSYFGGADPDLRHIAIRFLKKSPLHSSYHFYFDYDKLTPVSDIETLLKLEIEKKLKRYQSDEMGFYKNLAILDNEFKNGNLGAESILRVSFDNFDDKFGSKLIEETKFAIKDNFLLYAEYRNVENKFSQILADNLIDEIMTSFESQKKNQGVLK